MLETAYFIREKISLKKKFKHIWKGPNAFETSLCEENICMIKSVFKIKRRINSIYKYISNGTKSVETDLYREEIFFNGTFPAFLWQEYIVHRSL